MTDEWITEWTTGLACWLIVARYCGVTEGLA